ncbi:MAG TPA: ABC transporter permease [Candidatus Angelobacter sp.]|nr:ABC transporter permease [Candidatus Angelobacter sp.]
MTLLRVLHAEMLKMKRTIALKMVLLAPLVVVLLVLFITSQAPFGALHRNGIKNEWIGLANLGLFFWALLMMPLYVTLESALVAGLDHSENHWKSLLARPVPRWTFPVTKLIVLMAMTAAGTLVLLCGILISGAILPKIQPEVHFGLPVPWRAMVRDYAQVLGLMFLPLTIQQWVSLRWKSFSVATSTGIVATVIAFFAVAASRAVPGWPQYFPWALPMLVLVKQSHNIAATLAISGGLGLLVAAASCRDFCRHEVT